MNIENLKLVLVLDHFQDACVITDEAGYQVVSVHDTAILLDYSKKLLIDHWARSQEASIEFTEQEQRDLCRRIVACVNACVGISTENLEQNKPLKEGLHGLNERIRNTEQQRDELQRINTLLFQDAYSVYTDACESAGLDPELMEAWKPKYLRVINRHARTKGGAACK